jgi:hypothetical protein
MVSEKDKIVVLADISPSMSEVDGGSRERKTRFDLLRQALDGLPNDVRLIVFSDTAREVSSIAEMRPSGDGTALHRAIKLAATFSPVRTVIISDGEPDSENDAREAVEDLTGVVDVIFCGSPSNSRARRFLESLAKSGMGGYYETGDKLDIAKQLPAVIRGLLGQ